MNRFFTLFFTGGTGYCFLEIIWRGRTHWTMFLLGGACLWLLYFAFSYFSHASVIFKAIIGGCIITAAEFITGCVVNLFLDWNVWNYSLIPYNFLGQICLMYSLLWTLLSIPIAVIFKRIEKYI